MTPRSSSVPNPTPTWDWPLQREDVKIRNFCDRFEVTLDMHYFKPREIDVKVAGNEVVIHCRREKRIPESGRAREILRAYHLPKDTDVSTMRRHLAHGRLVISAQKKH